MLIFSGKMQPNTLMHSMEEAGENVWFIRVISLPLSPFTMHALIEVKVSLALSLRINHSLTKCAISIGISSESSINPANSPSLNQGDW